jgi:hypothetical protein
MYCKILDGLYYITVWTDWILQQNVAAHKVNVTHNVASLNGRVQ